jgi:hypothetical protein
VVGAEPGEVVVVELVVSVFVGEQLGEGVDEGREDAGPVTMQKQADDTRDGSPWHCDT